MRCLPALFVLLILIPSLVSGITSETTITATGGLHHNVAYEAISGDKISLFGPSSGEYHRIGAAQGIVTGMGNRSRLTSTVTVEDGIDSSTELYYSSGGTYFDTLASSHLQPNESELACVGDQLAITDGLTTGSYPVQAWVDGQMSGMGRNVYVVTDKSADSEGYAFSQTAVGQGLWQKDIMAGYLSGDDKDSNTLNDARFMQEHDFASGFYNVSADFIFEDFSDPIFNETELDESGNITPDEEE